MNPSCQPAVIGGAGGAADCCAPADAATAAIDPVIIVTLPHRITTLDHRISSPNLFSKNKKGPEAWNFRAL
jgi:hypothetical protein